MAIGSGKEKKQMIEGLMNPATDSLSGYLSQGIPQSPSAVSDYVLPVAQGDFITGGSPSFLAAQDYQAGKLADDVNRTFSGLGRYGSGAHTGVLADSIGQFRNQGLASEIGRQEQNQLTAAGMLSGEQQQGVSNAFAGLNTVPNLLAGDPRQGNQFGGALGGAISGLASPFPILGALAGGVGGWLGGY